MGAGLLLVACGQGEDIVEPQLPSVLQISTLTTGTSPDPDGYSVTLGDEPAMPIEVNDTVGVTDLSAGSYAVTLGGVAGNCVVQGNNPRKIDVLLGATASLEFRIVCSTAGETGALLVTVTTSGQDLDPDGYLLTVDRVSPLAISINSQTPIQGIPVGLRQVRLTGLAANCGPPPPNPQTATIESGHTAALTFDVTCWLPRAGRLWFARFPTFSGNTQIVIQTPDGLDLRTQAFLAGLASHPRLAPDEQHFAFVGSEGEILISDANATEVIIWGGCRPSAGSPVFAPDGQSVLCLFTDLALHQIEVDQSPSTKLTPDGYPISSGTWSPDGSAIAFRIVGQDSVTNGIYVMPLATGVPQLIRVQQRNDFDDSPPIWSPDGSRILFGGNFASLWLMQANGLGLRVVVDTAGGLLPEGLPAWSPDGGRIAFAGFRSGDSELFVVGLDGSPPVQITDGFESVSEPSWSPDGGTLVFSGRVPGTSGGARIVLVNPDGSGVTQLSGDPGVGNDFSPAWLP